MDEVGVEISGYRVQKTHFSPIKLSYMINCVCNALCHGFSANIYPDSNYKILEINSWCKYIWQWLSLGAVSKMFVWFNG